MYKHARYLSQCVLIAVVVRLYKMELPPIMTLDWYRHVDSLGYKNIPSLVGVINFRICSGYVIVFYVFIVFYCILCYVIVFYVMLLYFMLCYFILFMAYLTTR